MAKDNTLTLVAIIASLVAVAAVGTKPSIVVTIEAPGVQKSTAKFNYVGMEKFDSLPAGHQSGPITTNFGFTNNSITATYEDLTIKARDIYGGAYGIGMYPVAYHDTPYRLRLHEKGHRGVNYFGYWLSALDGGNYLELHYEGENIFSFTAADVENLVKDRKEYLGNPTYTDKQDSGEPFVFINFFCKDCVFDEVVFTQSTGSGYESDNHSVGHYNETSGEVVVVTTTTTTTSTTKRTTTTPSSTTTTTTPPSTTTTTTTTTTPPSTTTTATTTVTIAATTSFTATGGEASTFLPPIITTTIEATTDAPVTSHRAPPITAIVVGATVGGIVVLGTLAGVGYWAFHNSSSGMVNYPSGEFEVDDVEAPGAIQREARVSIGAVAYT